MPELHLGIDLGGTNVKLGVCDAVGTVRGRLIIDTDVAKGPDDVITRIALTAHSMLHEHGRAATCGIGAPGELDVGRQRLVRANHFPGWADVNIVDQLKEQLHIPTVLENDANCAAWGEFVAGAGRGSRSLACFTLGTGVGGGLIVAGELWIGANGAAAAFGHIAVDPNGPQCRCGQRGCVETYASATSLAARYGRGSAADAFAAAERGDIGAIQAIDWSCDGLAAGVANVIHTVQPEVVVLAGGMAAAGAALADRVRLGVAQRVRAAWLKDVRIELSRLAGDAGWVGAALWSARRLESRRAAAGSFDFVRS